MEELISLARQDRELRNDLLEKVQFASETMSYTKLSKMIKLAIPRKYLYEYVEVRRYFRFITNRIFILISWVRPFAWLSLPKSRLAWLGWQRSLPRGRLTGRRIAVC